MPDGPPRPPDGTGPNSWASTPHEPDGSPDSRDDNRMLPRRSPVSRSDSGLVSRDYQPRTGGPELVASWPLGTPPSGASGRTWAVADDEAVVLQRNFLQLPYALPVDYSRSYLSAVGRGAVEDGGTLSLSLACEHLSGKPYETTVELSNAEEQPFVTPMVEFTPETPEYERYGRVYGGYELSATADGGSARLDRGTSVQLWSE